MKGLITGKFFWPIVLVLSLAIVPSVSAQDSEANFDDSGGQGSAQNTSYRYIENIDEFLKTCPQNDPVYELIRSDFKIRRNGVEVGEISCTEPYSGMQGPSEELILLQSLRVLYYMDLGQSGHLPWTPGTLYDWMRSKIWGFDIRDDASNSSCCQFHDDGYYVTLSAIPQSALDAYKGWGDLSGIIALLAHETRHMDGFSHVSCCVITNGCDQTFGQSNLSPYGIQWWLYQLWLTGGINVGLSCLDPAESQKISNRFLDGAKSYDDRFCDTKPPLLTRPQNPGGDCGDSASPPIITSFATNNGDSTTKNTTVRLNNACIHNPTHYMASEFSNFKGATWKSYSSSPTFALSSGCGTKTVYLKTKNAYGESLPVDDTIEFLPVACINGCVPNLISPINGAMVNVCEVAKGKVLLDFYWSDCPGATQYQVRFYHPLQSKPFLDKYLTASPYHVELKKSSIPDQYRFGLLWKVRSKVNGAWGNWSSEGKFNVDLSCTNPSACVPTLISPYNGAVLMNGCEGDYTFRQWDFVWSLCPGATQNEIRIYPPGASRPSIDISNLQPQPYAPWISYPFRFSASISDPYRSGWHWNARAMVNGEWGPWSKDGNFDVEPMCQGPNSVLTIFTNPAGGGVVRKSIDRGAYWMGELVVLQALPNPGYEFRSWSGVDYHIGNVAFFGNVAFLNMSGDRTVIANFSSVSAPSCNYALTMNVSPLGSGTVTKNPEGSAYCARVRVDLGATAKSGYGFSSWTGVDSSNGAEATVTMNSNRTVTANFTSCAYALTVNVNPSGSGTVAKSLDKSAYCAGDQVYLTATPASGYAFSSWTGVDSSNDATATVTMNGNRTVTANFAAVSPPSCTYALTVNVNPSGSGTVAKNPDKSAYCAGDQVTLTATPASGYVFVSWTGVDRSMEGTAWVTIYGNRTVTANFTPVTCIPTLISPTNWAWLDNGCDNGQDKLVWDFTWSECPGATYELTVSPVSQVASGPLIYENNLPSPSFHFETDYVQSPSNWWEVRAKVNGVWQPYSEWRFFGVEPINTDCPNPNCNYTLAVNINPVNSGVVAKVPYKNTFCDGEVVTLTATPVAGYKFSFWTRADSVNGATATVTMNGNRTVTANFAPLSPPSCTYALTVNVNPSGSGTVGKSPDKSAYCAGDQVALIASGASGYVFSSWTGVDSSNGATATVTMNDNRTVTANFMSCTYALTTNVNPSGSGTVAKNPNQSAYCAGDQVYLNAIPASGYVFSSWTGVDSSSGTTATVVMNSNRTIIANFSAPPPCVPTLISPTNGAVMDNGCQDGSNGIVWDFDWSDCPGATYDLRVWVDKPGLVLPYVFSRSDLTSSFYHYEAATYVYVQDTKFQWGVRPRINGVYGPWSETGDFNVEPVNTDCP